MEITSLKSTVICTDYHQNSYQLQNLPPYVQHRLRLPRYIFFSRSMQSASIENQLFGRQLSCRLHSSQDKSNFRPRAFSLLIVNPHWKNYQLPAIHPLHLAKPNSKLICSNLITPDLYYMLLSIIIIIIIIIIIWFDNIVPTLHLTNCNTSWKVRAMLA